MLRITSLEPRGSVVLRVEGRLVGPWIEELREACERHHPSSLDLRGLLTADAGGLELLHRLASSGTALLHLSAYLTALLSEPS